MSFYFSKDDILHIHSKLIDDFGGSDGINLTTAINVFLRKSLTVGGFPFDVRIDEPNRETTLALLEADKISKVPNVKGLDAEDALRELKK